MSWISRLMGRNSGPKANPQSSGDAFVGESGWIQTLVSEARERHPSLSAYGQIDLGVLSTFQSLMEMDRPLQAERVHHLTRCLVELDQKAGKLRTSVSDRNNPQLHQEWQELWQRRSLLFDVISRLLARKLPLDDSVLESMLDWILTTHKGYGFNHLYPLNPLLGAIEERTKSGDLADSMAGKLEQLGKVLESTHQETVIRKAGERIQSILGRAPEIPITAGEVWADAAIQDLAELSDPEHAAWIGLLACCKAAAGSAPSAKWRKQATGFLEVLDRPRVASMLAKWFVLTDKKRSYSALTLHQWNLRCAEDAFGKRKFDFLQLLPADKRRWSELEILDKALRESDDPWTYLREFHHQPEARSLFGEQPPTFELRASPPEFAPVEDLLIIPAHMELLAGLAWVAGMLGDPALTRSLGMMAVSMYRKVPGKGPRAVRVGNACVTALGMIGDEDALGQLALLKVKVKFGGAQAAIDKTLARLAETLGVSRGDLEEMSVPAYGLTEVGRLSQEFGEFNAELTVIDSRSTALSWLREDGKPQKSVPTSVKKDYAEDLKELTAAKKDIERMLPAIAERLDALYLKRKSWPFKLWRERYLDHPLTGALVRRLLWNFTREGKTVTGVWLNERLVDRLNHPIEVDDAETTVSLWHPLHQESSLVLGWRSFLEEWQVVQPFKQVHREVYLLTPAEENTRVYSNRFAAHLLRQHQFHALCAARGWKNQLRLMVDASYPPATRWLPEWDLRAEYWIEGAGTEYGEDTLDSGAYRYVATDQVRFYQIDASQVEAHAGGGGYGGGGWRNTVAVDPIPLEAIDPLVFSEVMRDVDLFVGVGSVGNDPTWLDGGRNELQRGYWQSYSFGELGATALTRKSILEKLIPRLKIAAVCSFEEKFLVVRGKRHSYRIHLGSGNILIMPQDRYLCIVPAQAQVEKAGERLFLPFEGDRTLSLILSKALLLAADDKITDNTILRQLG